MPTLSIAVNPFKKITGVHSLIFGILVVLGMSYFGVNAKMHFPGILDFVNSSVLENPKAPLDLFLVFYQVLISWLILSVLFIIFAKIFQQKRLRIIDFFGAVAFSRFPYLILTLSLIFIRTVFPSYMNIDYTIEVEFEPFIMMSLFILILLLCGIWQITTYFYALKVSSGLTGKKLWISFISSIILGEIISSQLIRIFSSTAFL